MNYRSTTAASWRSRSPPRRVCCSWTETRAGRRMNPRPTSSRPRCGSRRRASAMPKSPFDVRTVDLVGGTELPDLKKTETVVLANVENLGASDADAWASSSSVGAGCSSSRATASGRGRSSARRGGPGCGRGPRAGERDGDALAARAMGGASTRSSSHSPTPSTATFAGRRSPRSRGSSPIQESACWHGSEAVSPRSWSGRKGRGKVLWFTSACDRAWGDWPRGRMYLPMIHQMIAYVSGLAEGGRIRQAIAGDEQKPGVVESDGLVQVVNADPLESADGALHAQRVRRPLRLPTARAGRARPWPSTGTRGIADDRLRSDEIWPWLALTLVGLLLVENFLANRTAA